VSLSTDASRLSTAASQRKGWYYGWNIVAVSILSTILVNGLAANSFSLFLHDWSVELHCSISSLLLGMTIMGVSIAFVGPFVGVMADKYPIRLVFGIGLVAMTVMCIAMSFITAVWQIQALYALLLPIAVCFSALIPANAVISRWFVHRLGLAMGLAAFGVSMAGVVLPPIIAWILPFVGWRMIWRVGGVLIGFVFSPIVLLVLRDRATEREGLHYMAGAGENAMHIHHGPSEGNGLTSLDVLARKNFRLLVIVALPMMAAYFACLQNLAPIVASHGLSQHTAGGLLSAFSLTHLVASLLAGLLSDRLGNRLPLSGLALLTAIGGLFMAFGSGLPSLSLGVVLIGASGGVWPLLGAAIAVEFGSNGFGRAFGLFSAFLPAAGLMAFIVAKLQESTGSYALGFSALAAIALLGGAGGLLMRERREGSAGALNVTQASPLPARR
jgi:MFS family permease